jgi:hypothetical protein
MSMAERIANRWQKKAGPRKKAPPPAPAPTSRSVPPLLIALVEKFVLPRKNEILNGIASESELKSWAEEWIEEGKSPEEAYGLIRERCIEIINDDPDQLAGGMNRETAAEVLYDLLAPQFPGWSTFDVEIKSFRPQRDSIEIRFVVWGEGIDGPPEADNPDTMANVAYDVDEKVKKAYGGKINWMRDGMEKGTFGDLAYTYDTSWEGTFPAGVVFERLFGKDLDARLKKAVGIQAEAEAKEAAKKLAEAAKKAQETLSAALSEAEGLSASPAGAQALAQAKQAAEALSALVSRLGSV